MTACVYRAFAADGTLLYIGQSGNPTRRIASHRSGSPWARQAVCWTVSEPMPRADALDEEAVAIYLEQPVHNVDNRKRLDGVYARWEKSRPESGVRALRLIGDEYMRGLGDLLDWFDAANQSAEEFRDRVVAAIRKVRAEHELGDADVRWALANWFGPPILARHSRELAEAHAARRSA